jgi:UDP-2,3-diacylglucosamine pyrophosphatase LpxH
MSTRYLIVSDLHLGAADATEDFLLWGDTREGPATPESRVDAARALDARFAEFLDDQFTLAASEGAASHLILLGDFVDLWQAKSPGESARDTLVRILETHVGVVAALRAWIGRGGAITLVLGNHDHALCHRKAWALLSEILPGLNASVGGVPVWSYRDEAAGLWAVHGHRWDRWNRIRPRRTSDCCVGRIATQFLVTPLEREHPLADKGDTLDFLHLLAQSITDASVGRQHLALVDLLRGIERGAPCFADFLAAALGDGMFDIEGLRATREGDFERAFRRELRRVRGVRSNDAPRDPRFIVHGHTHVAGRREIDGVAVLNSGTWRPILTRGGEVEQPLDYVVLREIAGAWTADVMRAEPQRIGASPSSPSRDAVPVPTRRHRRMPA